jgi:hypothetical protein
MSDVDLLVATTTCYRNLTPLRDDEGRAKHTGPDVELRYVLVPELWERLKPGTRAPLRRIQTTLAEYYPTDNIFSRILSKESRDNLRKNAEKLRSRIALMSEIDVRLLLDQTVAAISESSVLQKWLPSDFVYEPGFTFRLIPVIAQRVASRLL